MEHIMRVVAIDTGVLAIAWCWQQDDAKFYIKIQIGYSTTGDDVPYKTKNVMYIIINILSRI